MQYSFGDCLLDLENRQLWRDGDAIHMRTKVFDTLHFLIVNRGRLVGREELLAHAWSGVNVSDATLSSCIRSVRQAIGDEGNNQRYIQTVRGQGFRFVAEVSAAESAGTFGVQPHSGNPIRNDIAIAVLPFENLNDNDELDFVAAGLADDITTALSRFKAFSVIAQSSSFQFRESARAPREIGAVLGAEYVLSGNVRCDGTAFRTSAHLVHVSTNREIWADRYDGRIESMLSVQDDITRAIATSIKPEIDLAEIRRAASQPREENLQVRELAWQARALLDRSRLESNPALHMEGIALAEKAAALDPNCRQAWWTISVGNFLSAFARQGNSPDAHLARSREAAERLRALNRNDHSAYMALGWNCYIERDFDRAMTNLEYAYALNSNCTMTLMLMGVILTATGRPVQADEYLSHAIRLSPRDLWLGFMLAAKAFTYYAMGRYECGAEYVKRAIEREPTAPANHVILAACLAEIGDIEGAGAAVIKQREISARYLEEFLNGERLPYRDPVLADRYASALVRAADAAQSL